MQRHVNGGANVRAIDAFVAMTGNIGIEGGGARYGHLHTWGFNYNAMLQKPPVGSIGMPGAAGTTSEFGSAGEVAQYSDRSLNISQTAKGILEANEPPVRMLWVACKNPFAQDFDRSKMEKAFEKLEMVVCADQFFNETVQHADIVLPVTTAFEEWNVDASYWHYWLSINQPAIKPMYEAKCDLEIAVLLSRTINKLEPGSCTFPQEFNHKRWLDQEFNDGMAKMFGISSWDDLLDGPKKAILPSSAAWYDRKFKTPQESLSSDLSCVRKMVIRRCRNTNRRRKARCHSTCLHRMCSSVSIPNLSTLTGCRSSIRSRLSICIRFPQKKEALPKTTW